MTFYSLPKRGIVCALTLPISPPNNRESEQQEEEEEEEEEADDDDSGNATD